MDDKLGICLNTINYIVLFVYECCRLEVEVVSG